MRAGRFTLLNGVSLGIALAFLYVPLLLVIVFSFNASRLVTVWGGFSTRWYGALVGNGPLLEAAGISVRVAAVSAALATGLGTLAALALAARRPLPGRAVFGAVLMAPIVLPEIVLGLAFLLFFVAVGVERGFGTLVIAHATVAMPFCTLVMAARLATLDRDLVHAASDLGAGPVTAFRTVTLPALRPALAAAFVLAFTLSFDDLVIASFVTGPGATTLPLRLYASVRLGVTPEVNAAASLVIAGILAITLALAGIGRRPGGRAPRPEARNAEPSRRSPAE